MRYAYAGGVKAAYLGVAGPVNRTLATSVVDIDSLIAMGKELLRSVEALANPCAAASQSAGQAPPAAAPGAATKEEPEGEILPNEAYTGPGTVSEDGLAAKVLEPGSELPSDGEAAAAAGVLAAGAAAISVAAARRREPAAAGGGILPDPRDAIRERIKGMTEDEARRILRRARLPRDVVNGLDDPVGTLMTLATAVRDPRQLAKAVRETLVHNPAAAEALLHRAGVSPPLIALVGPERVVRSVERLVRNPPRAIAAFAKDVAHNLTHPKDLARHVLNGAKRLVENSPFGAIAGLFRGLFRHRPRAPRVSPPPPQPQPQTPASTVPSAAPVPGGTPTTLASEPPPPLVDPDPGGETAIPR